MSAVTPQLTSTSGLEEPVSTRWKGFVVRSVFAFSASVLPVWAAACRTTQTLLETELLVPNSCFSGSTPAGQCLQWAKGHEWQLLVN